MDQLNYIEGKMNFHLLKGRDGSIQIIENGTKWSEISINGPID